jgi:uncharacterized protein YegP (UPF0339 family)
VKFEIFPRITLRGRRWFFRARARNGKILLQSEGYKNRHEAYTTVAIIRTEAMTAPSIELRADMTEVL